MKATYNGPEFAVSIFGLTFPKGEARDIPADNKDALAKLPAHPEFEVTGGPPAAPPKKPPKE